MNRKLLLGFIACATLFSGAAYAQKRGNARKSIAPSLPVIKTSNDTLSYALGANSAQGLPMYLQQIGVLGDTASVAADYRSKISAESGTAAKAKLQKELKFKIDSINNANTKNLSQFIMAFQSTVNTNKDQAAYNAGVSVGGQVAQMMDKVGTELMRDAKGFNRNAFVSAFVSQLKGEKPLVVIDNPEALIQARVQQTQKLKEQETESALKEQYKDKIAAGEKFFAENKQKPGVVTLPSGVQYKIENEGNGTIPKMNEKVKVHYHGTLLDGTVFDSSVDRGEPIDFNVGQLIPGFNEALMLMPEGSKWTVYIPYNLAYGTADRGTIQPFSDLIFEIELLQVGEGSPAMETNEEQAPAADNSKAKKKGAKKDKKADKKNKK